MTFNTPAQTVNQGKFAVKAGAGIGLGNGISITTPAPLNTDNSSVTDFDVDFGYSFWRTKNMALEVNIGLGYTAVSTKFDIEKWDYSYAADANADMDGNSYDRHYELANIEQKINTGYFTLPVYLSYRYCFGRRFALHADAGVRLGFKMSASMDACSGDSYSYGIYPEYDNLKIDADWMNGFGNREINKADAGTPEVGGIDASLIFGVGAEIGIAGPLSLDLGVRYALGMSDIYVNSYTIRNQMTAETVPVSYTVAGGELVRPLSGYLTKSKLSQLALRIGVVFRF